MKVKQGLKLFRTTHRGVTLIELTIVVLILGTLIALFAGSLGDQKKTLSSKTAKLELQKDALQLGIALTEYRNTHGSYPDEGMGLRVLTEQVPGAPENWTALTSKNVIEDPFKRVYDYQIDENGIPKVQTLGQDGQPGGEGDNADTPLELNL